MLNYNFLTYDKCIELIKGGRSKIDGYKAKKLGNNTYLYFDGHAYHVRLYRTDIVSVLPQNEWILRSGGWYTPLTKDRINTYNPVRLYQENYEWFFIVGGERHDFYDGIHISKELLVEELL